MVRNAACLLAGPRVLFRIMRKRACHSWLLVVLVPWWFTGCVHREIVVRSTPPGATCYFNGEPVGTTPVTFDFQWYGGHRITLSKEGYEIQRQNVRLKAPFYLYVPLDLLAELWPGPIRDRHSFDFVLTPLPPEKRAPVSPVIHGTQ